VHIWAKRTKGIYDIINKNIWSNSQKYSYSVKIGLDLISLCKHPDIFLHR